MKRLAGVFLISLVCFTGAFAQLKRAYESNEVVWLGVDFSHATFTDLKASPVNQDLVNINRVIFNEPKKFNINKFFNKEKVVYDLRMVNKINEAINPGQLIETKSYLLDSATLNKIVAEYKFDQENGLGLIFIAENLNTKNRYGTFHVLFIDLATNQIVYSSGMRGNSGGSSFRNQWANAVYFIMHEWEDSNLYN